MRLLDVFASDLHGTRYQSQAPRDAGRVGEVGLIWTKGGTESSYRAGWRPRRKEEEVNCPSAFGVVFPSRTE